MEYVKNRKDGKPYSPNWRVEKRYMRQSAVYLAWCEGCEAAEWPKRFQVNRYPPGQRRDEFQRGLDVGLAEVKEGIR